MKFFCRLAAALLLSAPAFAQTIPAKPKLVVGVVVDQMRWDYLYRYQNRYTANGFRRMLREGTTCENTFIPYTPTYTAPGHASVYTGSVPALHGIVGNNWYNRELGRGVYCTEDTIAQTVGSTGNAGKMSPRNMWSSTITDEVRLANNFRGKTIGIALKDRGAILPAGHTANAAYWYENGNFITSNYYMQQLPEWVQRFNARKLVDQYMAQPWKTLYPIETYVQSTADDKPYEGRVAGSTTFLHRVDTLKGGRYEAFRTTPYGNTYTMEMAKAAIEGEQLGADAITDFLTVSFSSPDYIGHTFGPNSIEAEDGFLRLDQDLAALLQYLDNKVGKGQYLLFLTADHGAAHVPGFAEEHHLPAGVRSAAAQRAAWDKALEQAFGVKGLVLTMANDQVFLNYAVLQQNKLDRQQVKQVLTQAILQDPAIARVIDLDNIAGAALPKKVELMVANGYNQRLSGDVQYLFKPNWFDGGKTGTTHGLWNPYDSHIPLLFFGWKIKPGKVHREIYMTDIAPTLAALLQVQMPNASVGEVIMEVIPQPLSP